MNLTPTFAGKQQQHFSIGPHMSDEKYFQFLRIKEEVIFFVFGQQMIFPLKSGKYFPEMRWLGPCIGLARIGWSIQRGWEKIFELSHLKYIKIKNSIFIKSAGFSKTQFNFALVKVKPTSQAKPAVLYLQINQTTGPGLAPPLPDGDGNTKCH